MRLPVIMFAILPFPFQISVLLSFVIRTNHNDNALFLIIKYSAKEPSRYIRAVFFTIPKPFFVKLLD